jgi:hypothetical protein
MNTEQIVALAEKASALDHNECADWYSEELLTSIPALSYAKNARFIAACSPAVFIALVQERGVLKHRSEYLAAALADEQNESDKLEIKLVDAAAEIKVLRDALEKAKTMPMKYRRMAFNAELQDENRKLREELNRRIKLDEQSEFEDWLEQVGPSGDVDEVQRQWEANRAALKGAKHEPLC